MNYVLIIIVLMRHGPAVESIDGFGSKDQCMIAAQEVKAEFDDLRHKNTRTICVKK